MPYKMVIVIGLVNRPPGPFPGMPKKAIFLGGEMISGDPTPGALRNHCGPQAASISSSTRAASRGNNSSWWPVNASPRPAPAVGRRTTLVSGR
jgi:hypothetical protein